MKIGIDIRLIGKKRTGDEAVFFHLVKNLAVIDEKNEYFLFTDRDPAKNPELAEEINKLKLKDNFKVIVIDSPNRFWWNLWALPNYLRQKPVDIFHTQYIAPFWLPKKVRLVLTIHDISFNFFPQFIKFSDLFFLKTLIPRSLRMASKIIAVSEFTKKEIEKYYRLPAEKIAVSPNGVDFELFHREIDQDELEKIRKKYQLPEKFLLYLGTLQPRKNIPILIEAMKILQEKYKTLLSPPYKISSPSLLEKRKTMFSTPPATPAQGSYSERQSEQGDKKELKLVIAGNRQAHNFDPKIDKVIKKYNLQEKIIFPGWIEEKDKVALYKLAECFVIPSLYEGFGLPIVEAMAAGTPVVCSNQEAFLEVGDEAILASDPNNPLKIAENIYRILTDESLRKDLREKGTKQAKTFSWQKTAEKTLETYEKLAN